MKKYTLIGIIILVNLIQMMLLKQQMNSVPCPIPIMMMGHMRLE